ncbi:MAG TPA: galactokinase family protein [Candidatus Brocadiia bacterium]|nr:galactokinase family protein [Candidatus Brocadiia bacterium]
MLKLGELRNRISRDDWVRRLVGDNPQAIKAKRDLLQSVLHTFATKYGDHDRPVCVSHVPGRLEFLGKHTDYAGGPVLNMATERGFMAISAANGSTIYNLQENNPEWAGLSLDLSSDEPHSLWSGDVHWFTYPCRTLERFQGNLGKDIFRGVDMAFGSDLPPASGMSSSSALMILTYLAALPFSRIPDSKLWKDAGLSSDPLEQARYLACCENGQSFVKGKVILDGSAGVGTFGGSQDQTAIFTAKQGKLTVNRYCPTFWELDVDWPADLSIAISFSGYRASKTQEVKDAFNRLSLRARTIPEAYAAAGGDSVNFAGQLLDRADIEARLAKAESMDEKFRKLEVLSRYKQFYAECRDVIPQAVTAIRSRDYGRLGDAIDRSHALSKLHLRNIKEEVDVLVKCAKKQGAIGATGFGGGFGGSAFAVIRAEESGNFLDRWKKNYLSECGAPPHEPLFFHSVPASCACEVFPDE